LVNNTVLVAASAAVPLIVRDMTDEQISALSWTTFQKMLNTQKLVLVLPSN
jgi:hypothetical protein